MSEGSDDSSEETDYSSNCHMALDEKVELIKADANKFYGEGQYGQALDKYEEALQINEAVPELKSKLELLYKLKNNVAQCWIKKKEYMKALEAAVDAIEGGSDQARSYTRAAHAFKELNKPDFALITLEKGTLKCYDSQRTDVQKELAQLRKDFKQLKNIKQKNWQKADIKELVDRLKKEIADKESNANDKNEKAEKKSTQSEEVKKKNKEERAREAEELKRKKEEEMERKVRQEMEHKVKEDLKKDMEEKIMMAALPKEINNQVKFTDYLKKGSEAFQNNVASTAFDNMGRALDLIKQDYDNLGWSKNLDEKNNPDVVTIRYIYARAGVETSVYENIMAAKENFEMIINVYHCKSVRFPAVYYGLALLYMKLNRFDKSKEYVDLGLKFLEKRLSFTPVHWPGLPTKPLSETQPDNLKRLLIELSVQLTAPPLPDAVCKYTECTTHAHQTHILPSENIYLSDPDYRGHYRLLCAENCRLEYHKVCWGLLKSEHEWGPVRVTNDKDFLGTACLTPDCEGVINKVEIFNQDGESHKIEDAKLNERLKEEAKKRKQEESKRVEELKMNKDSAAPNITKKKKKKKAATMTPDSEIDLSEGSAAPAVASLAAGSTAVSSLEQDKQPEPVAEVKDMAEVNEIDQVDYSKVDLSNAVVLNRGGAKTSTENEMGDRMVNRKKKSKKKVLSLQELQAVASNGEVSSEHLAAAGDNDFDARIQKANKYKTLIENIGTTTTSATTTPSSVVSAPNAWTHRATNNSTSQSGGLMSNSESGMVNGGGVISAQVPASRTTQDVKGFIFDYLADLLEQTGPLHHTDDRIWILLQDYKDMINSYDLGLKSFVYMDAENRFLKYQDMICLQKDLAQAIQIENLNRGGQVSEADNVHPEVEEENDVKYETSDDDSECDDNDDEMSDEDEESDQKWLEVKKMLGETNVKEVETSSNEHMLKQLSSIPPALPNFTSSLWNRNISTGVQTDVSSIDLEDSGLDPFALAQTNEELVLELQEHKDKLTRLQKENKVELNELREKKSQLSEEASKLKTELSKAKFQAEKADKVVQDFNEKEKHSREEKDRLHQDIRTTKALLEKEQRLSFELNNKMKATNNDKDAHIKSLKIANIKTEEKYYKEIIDSKLESAQNLSKMLVELRHNPLLSQHADTIVGCMTEMDEYSARLTLAKDEVDQQARQKVQNLSPNDKIPKIDFDISKIAAPKLGINVFLFFLESQQQNFAQSLNTAATAKFASQHNVVANMFGASAQPQMKPQQPLQGAVGGPVGSSLGVASDTGAIRRTKGHIGAVDEVSSEDFTSPNQDKSPNSSRIVQRNSPLGFQNDSKSVTQSFSSPPPISRPSAPPSPFHSVPVRPNTPPSTLRGTVPPPIGTPIARPGIIGGGIGGGGLRMPSLRGGLPMGNMLPPGIIPPRPLFQPGLDLPSPQSPLFPMDQGPPGIIHPRLTAAGAQLDAQSTFSLSDSAANPQRKKNEDKLVDRICHRFPTVTQAQARHYVKQVRLNNGGKLTGMTVPIILDKVQELINNAPTDENNDCSICLNELTPDPYTTPCGHSFHKTCLDQWLQQEKSGNACPNCREFLTNDDEFPSLR